MGINVIDNLSTQLISAPAGSALTSGELLVNTESGSIFGYSNVLSVAQNNNTTAGASAIFAAVPISPGTSGYGSTQEWGQPNQAQLTNGTICVAYTGDDSTRATNLTLQFENLVGGNSAPTIAVSTGTSLAFPTPKALPNGGVVLAWTDSSGNLYYAIYTAAGATTVAPTTLSTGLESASSSGNWVVNVLTNGNIVFLYRKSSGVSYRIINSAGGTVLGETVVEASSSPTALCIRPQAAGGFVVYYYAGGTSTYKFARYNASGTLQGTLTTIVSGVSSESRNNPDNMCIELSNGNLVFAAQNASSYGRFYIYNSSGTLVRGATPLFNNGTVNDTATFQRTNTIPAMLSLTGGGFAIGTAGSARWYTTTYDNSGGQLLGITQSSRSPYSMNIPMTVALFDLGANFGIFSSTYQQGCSNVYFTELWVQQKSSGVLVGNAVTFVTGTSNQVSIASGILTSDGSVAVSYSWPNAQYWGTYAVQRKSIIGVAQDSVASGSNVRIGTVGTYTINTAVSTSGAFDQRTAVVPGAKGTVIGSTAILSGTQ
jgi:hypothetical protein